MQVLCENCKTEYEFDDALVSERGTTVKCTNCGHQFRIYRPKTGSSRPERWEVRTVDGRELVYTSMRDLQRGISRGQVGRNDILTRGDSPGRAIADIAELELFFPQQRTNPPPPMQRGEPGREPPAAGTGPLPPPRIPREFSDVDYEEATIPRLSLGTDSNFGRSQVPTDRPPPLKQGPPMVSGGAELKRPQVVEFPDPMPGRDIDDGARVGPLPPPPSTAVAGQRRVQQGAKPSEDELSRREDAIARMTPTPTDVRASYRATDSSLSDPRFMSGAPTKRSAAVRWIFAVVVLGAVVVVGATFGRKYLMRAASTDVSAEAVQDPRVGKLLEQGREQLRQGDLESAKASFDKASVLGESDVKVQQALAELENIRTDTVWLKLRLLDPEQAEAIRIAKLDLDARAKRGVQLAERACELSKDDPVSARLRVDAWRLAGDLQQARSWVTKLGRKGSDPQDAYVLAALEMSEASPNWTTVVDRLQLAEGSEQGFGRARAALVYVLVRMGKVEEARGKLNALEKQTRPHPLLLELKAYFARNELGEGQVAQVDTTDSQQQGASDALQIGNLPRVHQSEEVVTVGSYQDLLKRAHAARRRGDLDAAEQLFRAALVQNPGDTEALAGLGDIAKARGDKAGSMSYYEQVNQQNPSYLPAQMGLADAKWEAGDRAGAIVLYKQVVAATGGQGSYAQRAQQRINQGAGNQSTQGSGDDDSSGGSPVQIQMETNTEQKGSSTESSQPIDTTDLP